MTRAEGGRLCAECQTVVRDLSSMHEEEARALLASSAGARLCVRYLCDTSGRVVFAGDEETARARIVPAYKLTARAKARIAQAALLAAPLVLFEACGGAYGNPPAQNWQHVDADVAEANVVDANVLGDAADAGSAPEGSSAEGAVSEDGGATGDAEPAPAHRAR